MPERQIIRTPRAAFLGRFYLALAVLFCMLLGFAIILNVQMEGDSEWFWYANFLHQGVKLYADMHFALQPLFVLETNLRMLLFGSKCIPYEFSTLIHVLAMSIGLLLVLKESRWPDWQKALLLAACFPIVIQFNAYRFDDFHIVADCFVVYTLALLLILSHVESLKREFVLVTVVGVLSGMGATTDLTEGAALVVAAAISVPFLAPQRKVIACGLFLLGAVVAVVAVVCSTGDTLHDYAFSSIFRAATAKGGTGSVLRGARYGLHSNFFFTNLFHGGKLVLVSLAAIVAAGATMRRFWQSSEAKIVCAQMGIAALMFAAFPHAVRNEMLHGMLNSSLLKFAQPLMQVLTLLVAARWLLSLKRVARAWDAREMLILVPVGMLMACAASEHNGTSNGFLPMALLILMVPAIEPWGRGRGWANASFVTIVLLAGLSATAYKVLVPYSWFADSYPPMFEHRERYNHPLYGTMYVTQDLPKFIGPICSEIWSQGKSRPEMLTLPYSYPNYFCGIPPWHHYVQTWFDTVAPATVAKLMDELNTAPPEWIVYQRQLDAMRVHEVVYNHSHPLAHRALDNMIMQKIASGQWTLVDKRYYLKGDDGWLIIRTRPSLPASTGPNASSAR
jgi:hypothetical protein